MAASFESAGPATPEVVGWENVKVPFSGSMTQYPSSRATEPAPIAYAARALGRISSDASVVRRSAMASGAHRADHHSQPQGDAQLSGEEIIVSHEMTNEEQEMLDRFERGELRSIPGDEREMKLARRKARSSFNQSRRMNLRTAPRTAGRPLRRPAKARAT